MSPSTVDYLLTHNLEHLFKNLLTSLLIHRPSQPLQALIDVLCLMQENAAVGVEVPCADAFQTCLGSANTKFPFNSVRRRPLSISPPPASRFVTTTTMPTTPSPRLNNSPLVAPSPKSVSSPRLLALRRNSLQVPNGFNTGRRMSLPYTRIADRFESVSSCDVSCCPTDDEDEDSFDWSSPDTSIDLPRCLSPRFMETGLVMAASRGRRGSVSAESIKPSMEEEEEEKSVFISKSREALMRIASAMANNLLFRNLEKDQRRQVVDAMFERRVNAGEVVIKQGDEGDNFYIVDDGWFEVLINDKAVVEIGPGGSFGELALMYNTTRAATVRAKESGTLWAVDRITFHRKITNNIFRKRTVYQNWLRELPFLSNVDETKIENIVDALEPVDCEDGEEMVSQGDYGDRFYIVKEGAVRLCFEDEDGNEQETQLLTAGSYFGEIAILENTTSEFSATAEGNCRLVALSKDSFIRLLKLEICTEFK